MKANPERTVREQLSDVVVRIFEKEQRTTWSVFKGPGDTDKPSVYWYAATGGIALQGASFSKTPEGLTVLTKALFVIRDVVEGDSTLGFGPETDHEDPFSSEFILPAFTAFIDSHDHSVCEAVAAERQGTVA